VFVNVKVDNLKVMGLDQWVIYNGSKFFNESAAMIDDARDSIFPPLRPAGSYSPAHFSPLPVRQTADMLGADGNRPGITPGKCYKTCIRQT
jgi:hypothetical protein